MPPLVRRPMNLGSPLAARIHRFLDQPMEARKVDYVEDFSSSIGTAVGLVRDENQDYPLILYAYFDASPSASFVLFALCDGMGGMSEGLDCAKLALSAFSASLVFNRDGSPRKRIAHAAFEANETVHQRYKGRGGTTLSAILSTERDGTFGINVGDSRIFEFTRKGHLKQISTDDTIEAALAKLKGERTTTSRDEFLSGRLAQYVGMGEGYSPNIIRLKKLYKGTGYLITSDGAHQVPPDSFRSIVLHGETSTHVVDRILSLSEWCGGTDNATVVCVWPEQSSARMHASLPPGNHLTIWVPNHIINIAGQLSTPQFRNAAQIRHAADARNRDRATAQDQADPSQHTPKARQYRTTKGKHKSPNKRVARPPKKKNTISGPETDKPQLDIDFREADGEKAPH